MIGQENWYLCSGRVVKDDLNRTVAVISYKANYQYCASLTVAAPDMYRALLKASAFLTHPLVWDFVRGCSHLHYSEAAIAVREAIAKAERQHVQPPKKKTKNK